MPAVRLYGSMKELFWKVFTNMRAIVLAVIVHLLVLGVLVVNMDWGNVEPAAVSAPMPVKARAVEKDRVEKQLARAAEDERRQQEEQKRQQREKQEAQRRLAEEKRRKQQQEEQLRLEKKTAAEQKRKQEQARKRKLTEEAEKKRRQEQARKQKLAEEAEKKRLAEERKRQALLAEQRRQQAREEGLRQAMQDEENESKVRELTALIQVDVENNWKIPPTARKGMQCLLTVRLLPSGEVQNVQITRSSGDDVFDRSVQDAVYRASPLPVSSSSAGSGLFQTTFREFNFWFNPANL